MLRSPHVTKPRTYFINVYRSASNPKDQWLGSTWPSREIINRHTSFWGTKPLYRLKVTEKTVQPVAPRT